MKKFLSFIILMVYAVTGAWAGTIANNNGTITLDGLAAGDLDKALTDPTVWTSDNADDLNSATKVIFGSNVTLNDADLRALKTLVPAATQLNMAQVSLNEDANISNLETQAVEYLRLPNSMTSAEDVVEMGKLKQNGNANLKMVGAYDNTKAKKDGGNYAAVALYSWEANNVTSFISQMDIKTSGNPPTDVCEIRMAGEYGDKDLVSNGATGTPNFGYETSAEWDFTGAHFANCTIPATDAAYYNYDDPFCDGELVANTTSSNAFYYFSQYRTQVVNIKLPDNNMTNLPYRCLNDLGAQNKNGYIALYGQDAFDANKAEDNCVPLETLVIPDCYTDLEEECGKWARIRHLVVGSNVKRIHGGAFLKCDFLEDLDFAAGLSNCYVGDRSFNECKSMKHIALSEGIVSIGNGGFWNSQHLESIRLPQSLINIGNNAFNNCLALNSITIPENVEKIGKNAFTLCPFTDIYLTTTDPSKIPMVWSAGISNPGNGFGSFDGNCTFNHGHIDGWEGIPDTPQKAMLEAMSWDEAVAWYYINVNGIPVLHYPTQLADAVRAQISATYAAHSKADEDGKSYGLPLRSDMYKRSNVEGADLGTVGQGKYTKDGWAQFMLMKEFTTDPGGDVYSKEYDDVWYTMCFPFDLTDEQLAAAFNETFNIVDFSGVEVDKENQALILHFNNVALTDYKDIEGNHYKRKTNGGTIIREKDENSGFSYNVYIYKDENNVEHEFHHVNTSSLLSSNKTKTFAEGTSMGNAQSNFNSNKNARLIDGILATAGHPYMIHPAIGVNDGGTTKRRCDFAGITWLPQTKWEKAFTDNSRTVDLGVKKTFEERPDSNYNQAAYTEYTGQTYTFIGNPNKYQVEGAPEAPTIANGRLRDYPAKPTKEAYPTEPTKAAYPEEPTKAAYPEEPVMEEEPTMPTTEEITEAPSKVDNPADDTTTYPTDFQTLVNSVRCTVTYYDQSPSVTTSYTYAEDLANNSIDEFFTHYYDWGYQNRSTNHNAELDNDGLNLFKAYFNAVFVNGDYHNNSPEDRFNQLKSLASTYKTAKDAYDQYVIDKAAYEASKAEWDEYRAKKADYDANALTRYTTAHNQWEQECEAIDNAYTTAHGQWEQDCEDIDDAYITAHGQWEQDCEDIDDAYDAAVAQWQSDCDDVDTYNDGVYAAWEVEMAAYRKQIPKNAYFLGRKAGQYPKYYREMSEVNYEVNRTTGLWPQFTAVVIPNDRAIAGIEKKIDSGTALSKGFEMKFNEDFEGDLIDEGDIQTIIEDARKEGVEPKVEYMDVVVNINGQVVRRDSTSFEGLPKGIYIVNGKKYFVK